ncbi:MAG TPA: lactate utilization protein C, partial [Burkholderiales bacterium]|nr:lactate utilization protein C [Burkholderiales bacterium]
VGDYLRGAALPLAAVCWPEFAALDWGSAGVKVAARAARDDDLVGITGSFCAIAETGTLMLVSGSRTPSATSLLPETHVAIVRAQSIVSHMEEAWRLLRGELPEMPRAVNFVSGPSRPADIEQTVTLGAHGPYRVHIIVIAGG